MTSSVKKFKDGVKGAGRASADGEARMSAGAAAATPKESKTSVKFQPVMHAKLNQWQLDHAPLLGLSRLGRQEVMIGLAQLLLEDSFVEQKLIEHLQRNR
jgi:hypothetical protein